MSKRSVVFKGSMPIEKIDWFAKMLYNVCLDDVELMEVSNDENNTVISLGSDHVEAIANEAVTYQELEDSVKKQ